MKERIIEFVLSKICETLVTQGFYHKERITMYYKIMQKAAEKEFCEDNKITLDSFLKEFHHKASL